MARTIALLTALSLALPAAAATLDKDADGGTSAPSAGSPARKGGKQAAPKSDSKSAVRERLLVAKRRLVTAVGACEGSGVCDPKSPSRDTHLIALLEDADHQFMEACEACSTAEKCGRERERMRDGKNSLGVRPCD